MKLYSPSQRDNNDFRSWLWFSMQIQTQDENAAFHPFSSLILHFFKLSSWTRLAAAAQRYLHSLHQEHASYCPWSPSVRWCGWSPTFWRLFEPKRIQHSSKRNSRLERKGTGGSKDQRKKIKEVKGEKKSPHSLGQEGQGGGEKARVKPAFWQRLEG